MVNIASSTFGCQAGDIHCYCSNQDFGYGVRDCSMQACPNQDDANRVIAYGTQWCAS
ncbi:hypothetical protein GQ43DRAFT_444364, partial [Delitschia confertaspora ATCC 74209]